MGRLSGVSSEINVTPLADVMLVLLIIFMITLPLIQEGVYVNKATAINAQEEPLVDDENSTTLTVTRSMELYLGQDPVAEADLLEKLIERVSVAPELPLFIKSDVAVEYGFVVGLVTQARDAGVEKIGLLVDRAVERGR